MASNEKLPVRWGIGELPVPMTRAQATRYGNAHMDPALKRAGFIVEVLRSDPELHGGSWYRINVVKYY